MFVIQIASICLLIVFMIADAMCNQLEAEQSKDISTLTINTNSKETIRVQIMTLQNDDWLNHETVSVRLGNSRTIELNQKYPYYLFFVSSDYRYMEHCQDTLGKAFKYEKNLTCLIVHALYMF